MQTISIIRSGLIAAYLACMPVGAFAAGTQADTTALPPPPPPPAKVAVTKTAVALEPQEQQYYTIEVSKGKLVHLPAAASAVIASDPTVADVQVLSPSLVYVNGKNVGETTLLAVDSHDNEILQAVITVTHNISKLNSAVKSAVPDAKVSFQSVDGALIMRGDVDSPMQADEIRRIATPFLKSNQTLVNMLHPLGSNQVMLKVKVAEVDRSQLKTFGISLQSLSMPGNFMYGILNGRSILSTTNEFSSTANLPTQSATANTIFGSINNGSNNINGVIDALEDSGIVSTLAEPTLTTQSGNPASFLAGGQIPVPSISGAGGTASVGITYQPYGVSLNFTPTVLSKDRISMLVAPTVSSLSTTGEINENGFTIPALQTRQASTTVELGSGQSFVIAGLLENDHNNSISQFPFLGDLPVLGALFRSTSFQHNQTELVIIVTPYIIQGVNHRDALHDPTQGFAEANDAERILLGKLYKEQTAGYDPDAQPPVADTPHLQGPAGYVLK